MPKIQDLPQFLKPYLFHGLDLAWKEGAKQAQGSCPFCSAEGKLTVEIATGLSRCYVCGEGSAKGAMNPVSFLQHLWEHAEKATRDYSALAKNRQLLSEETLIFWGAARSPLTGDWLLPGHNAEGHLCTLYRFASPGAGKKPTLLVTSETGHGLFGRLLFDERKPDLYLCEGAWNGMALWEALRQAKRSPDGKLCHAASEGSSLLAEANVLAVPGANVLKEAWLTLAAGKRVFLVYDSDHPHKNKLTGQLAQPAGYAGLKRAARQLMAAERPPKELHWLSLGAQGYDPRQKSGWDVRDCLAGSAEERRLALDTLLHKLEPVPAEWLKDLPKHGQAAQLAPSYCESWASLQLAWRKARHWRQELADVLATMLAVAISTQQTGDQLFLLVVGVPSSGKNGFCDGMLVSKHCHPLDHLTGFHSGSVDKEGSDFSLIARLNGKTAITAEGDLIFSNPRGPEIMSQLRRIFDGSTGASYKNRKEDLRYTGLRTPWITACTPASLETDQARLGDRFLRVIIARPDDEETAAISKRVAHAALRAVLHKSNCKAADQRSPEETLAYRLTGGYVDWLRKNSESLLGGISVDAERLAGRVADLAAFVADLRARPHPDPRRQAEPVKEMPFRLVHQLTRLAVCLAAVLNRPSADAQVLRITRKVALDSARGLTFDFCARLAAAGRQTGLACGTLAIQASRGDEATRRLLGFLAQIDVAEHFRPARAGAQAGSRRWRLTRRMQALWERVVGNEA